MTRIGINGKAAMLSRIGMERINDGQRAMIAAGRVTPESRESSSAQGAGHCRSVSDGGAARKERHGLQRL